MYDQNTIVTTKPNKRNACRREKAVNLNNYQLHKFDASKFACSLKAQKKKNA